MITLSTARTVVRNFIPDDWLELQKIIVDKQSSEYAAYDHHFPTGDKEVQDVTAYFAMNDDFLAVSNKVTGELMGYISKSSKNPAVYDFGYCLHSAYWRQGFALEACRAVVDYIFTTLNAARIRSGTAALHMPSCRLLEKLGFVKTGESIASFHNDEEGQPIEFTGAHFQLTREDWQNTRTPPKKKRK